MGTSELYSAGCTALDLATTQYGLNQGYSEANPIYPEGYEVLTGVLVSAGFHLALRYALNKAEVPERSKAASWYGYGSVRCGAGIYNLTVIHGGENPSTGVQ